MNIIYWLCFLVALALLLAVFGLLLAYLANARLDVHEETKHK